MVASCSLFSNFCVSGILHPMNAYNLNVLKVKGRTDLFLKLEIIKKILIVISIAISIHLEYMVFYIVRLFLPLLRFLY